MNKLMQDSLVNALCTVGYITVVAFGMSNIEKLLGDKEDTFLMGVTFLTLFILSAAITGSLVLGKPILMYVSGQKTEAIKMFGYTLGWLALAFVILLVVITI